MKLMMFGKKGNPPGGFEIGLALFFFKKKNKLTKFAESMGVLLQIMTPVTFTIPILIEYKINPYFFLPIYLLGINGWLFFTRYAVFENNWEIENFDKKAVRIMYLIFAFLFILVLVFFITQFHSNTS